MGSKITSKYYFRPIIRFESWRVIMSLCRLRTCSPALHQFGGGRHTSRMIANRNAQASWVVRSLCANWSRSHYIAHGWASLYQGAGISKTFLSLRDNSEYSVRIFGSGPRAHDLAHSLGPHRFREVWACQALMKRPASRIAICWNIRADRAMRIELSRVHWR
jgi:hypothetical protein